MNELLVLCFYLLGLLELFLQVGLLLLHLGLPLLELLQLDLVLLQLLQLGLVLRPLHLQRLQLLLQVLHLTPQRLLLLDAGKHGGDERTDGDRMGKQMGRKRRDLISFSTLFTYLKTHGGFTPALLLPFFIL